MVFLPTLPISVCGFEKGSKGGKREAGRLGVEGASPDQVQCTSGRIKALLSSPMKLCLG